MLCLASAGVAAQAQAQVQGLQPIPALSGRVVDASGALSPGDRARLEARLAAFEAAQGTQIAVLLVPTTQPEDIASYTQRVGDLWKIGRRQVGDGLLLVVATQDRTLRIAPAKALEGAVPDLAARRVIEGSIAPRLRDGDLAGGLDAGLVQLMALIRGEGLAAPEAEPRPLQGGQGLLVFLFVVVPMAARLLSALMGRKRAALLTGSAAGGLAWWLGAGLLVSAGAALVFGVFALASAVLPRGPRWGPGGGLGHRGRWGHTGAGSWGSSWGGGGWGGAPGGGGFRSGGGGDFGGGGASGRW